MDDAPNELHPASWWAELLATSDRFDAVYFLENLAEVLAPAISSPLVRREVELAVTTVAQHLLRPQRADLAEEAAASRQRLAATLARVDREVLDLTAATAAGHAVNGDFAGAAAEAEAITGWTWILNLVVTALRLKRFDISLAMTLLKAGRSPTEAIRTGILIGRYRWWPEWLMAIGTRRALEGTLDDNLIAALDRCGYAVLTPAQSHVAGKLLSGDATALRAAALQLENMGEVDAAQRLRHGDLESVALAAKLLSL